MYKQGDKVNDIIFPLIIAEQDPNESDLINYKEVIGTGFLIGNRGYALTAAHVIDQLLEDFDENKSHILGIFTANKIWYPLFISEYEKHPSEDVGIIKLNNEELKSCIQVSPNKEHSSCQYRAWGYPRENAQELNKLEKDAKERPELIYTEGYVRRRITRELYPIMVFKGTQFYELSESVGGGYSGAPIINKKPSKDGVWELFGIYVGIKEGEGSPVGYAVRSDSFYNWVPEILECTIIEESSKI